jgi:hypothetical protein
MVFGNHAVRLRSVELRRDKKTGKNRSLSLKRKRDRIFVQQQGNSSRKLKNRKMSPVLSLGIENEYF